MLSKISILYIEDDQDVADEIIFFLEKQNVLLCHAVNGEEGLECFEKNPPDIIITDIQMPKIDGLDMITRIREENAQIPIIVTSAFNETEKLLRAIDLGVDSYMLKPINMKELLNKIKKLLAPIYLSEELKRSKAELVMMEKLQAKEKELSAYKERMDYAFSGSNDGVWDWNIVTGENYFSPRWKEIIGYQDQEINNSLEDGLKTVYPNDISLIEKALEKSFGPEKAVYEVEFRQLHKKGHLVWVLARGVVKFDETDKPIRMIGTHTDISEKKKVIQSLIESQENLSKAQSIAHLGSWKWNIDSKELIWSDEVYRIFGEKPQSFSISSEVFASYIPSEDMQKLDEAIAKAFKDKSKTYDIQHRIIQRSKEVRFVQVTAEIVYSDKGDPVEVIGTIHDITELQNAYTKLKEISITDELTGLHNRRYFNEVIVKEINRSKRSKKLLTFLMLDIDHFKLYNDNYGHLEGDIALSRVAKVLKNFTNREGDYAFRLGGEEFGAIFMYENSEDVKRHATNLLHSIESLKILHKHNTASDFVTASIGIVIIKPDNDLSVDELYIQADKMLYEAKALGRNQVKVFM